MPNMLFDPFSEVVSEMEESTEEVSGFVITDDFKAEWALDRIKETEREYCRIADLAKMKIEEIELKLKEAYDKKERRTSNLRLLLQDYFGRVPHKSTKTKESYQLLSAKLTLTHKAPKPDVDDGILLGWLKESGKNEYIKTTEKPMWGDLKKTLVVSGDGYSDPETGEDVPGVTLIPQDDEFTIEF